MDTLEIKEPIVKDESIIEYEMHEYEPITGSNLNNPGEIRINIETQDLYTHPSESYLLLEGELLKNDGTRYGDNDEITITNNGLMHCFSNIKYQLSGQEIESVFHPGQATTMLGILKYPDHELNSCWMLDLGKGFDNSNKAAIERRNYIIKQSDPKGAFAFIIPLKHIFGFAEDYNKVVYGFKHTLTLVRTGDKDAIFRAANVLAGKIQFSKISWFMPHVTPSDEEKFKLYKIIENKSRLKVAYRMRQCDTISVPQVSHFTWRLSVKSSPEKPRWIIIGFQTDKDGGEEKNAGLFDHCNLTNIYAMLNSTKYPVVDYNVSFTKNQFARLFDSAMKFRENYYNIDRLLGKVSITPVHYKNLYPVFVIDVSKQSERLKNSVTDIQVKAQFSEAVPENTEAFAVVISDREIDFESNGNKMNVII